MTALATRRLRDGVLSISSIGAVVAGIFAIDGTFGERLVGGSGGALLTSFTLHSQRLRHLPRLVQDTVGLQGGDLSSLAFFAVAGFVLFVFLLRS